ncbi:MAG: hypothetical protein A2Z18_06200 [Armatimonadetes bacterium RBG_16_58_9]|nr:MAG: hypothetical protein A2Z18_06200 [Armatimonadetes bacterium RBG_16_58_9]
MSLSPANVSALTKIAEAAGSSQPVESRLRQMLDVAREALGLDSLSLVASESAAETLRAWHSIAGDRAVDRSLLEREALGACAASLNPKRSGSRLVIPIPPWNGYRAAIISQGKADREAQAALLQVISSYVTVLIENERLTKAVESAGKQENKRLAEVAAIYEIGQAMDASHLGPLLDMIVSKAASVMEAQTCSLMLRNSLDGALVIEASHGLDEDIVKGTRVNLGEGIAGRVAQTGEPMLISDVSSDPRFAGGVKPRAQVTGSMLAPLKDETGAVRGVLSIRRHTPNPPFTEEDLKLFGVFATHAALAISNTELYARLHQKAQEMSTISEVLRSINSTLDLDHVLNQIAESITDVVGFDRCCVYLLDSRTNEFVAGARRGFGSKDKIKDHIRFDEGIIGLAAKERIPIFSHGSPLESDGEQAAGEFLVAPIVVRDSCIGVVVVDNCALNRPIQPQHVELLATFVSQAGIAVENARLYEAMEEKYAELNVLYEQSKSISAASGVEGAAETLVRTASQAVKCDGAAVLLLDTKRGNLALQACRGALNNCALAIEELAAEDWCVDFVREQRNPTLSAQACADTSEITHIRLLNALAPNGANLMLVPLVAEDTSIGLLALCRKKSEEFVPAEMKLISIVASHAATVLKSALAYDLKMRQRVLELTALYEFSKKISSAANLEEALDSILAIVADLVDCDESFIYAIDHERGVASAKAARFRGKPKAVSREEALDGSSVVSWAIEERKALVSPDITRDPRFDEPGSGKKQVRSLMSIPLIVQDDVVGALNVYSYSPNQYSEDDVRVLSIIASQGAAIYKELEALTALASYTDNILGSIAAGVVTLDSDGVVLTWNKAAEEIVGIRAARVVGLGYDEALGSLAVSAEDKDNIRKAIRGVFETGETYQGYKVRFHARKSDEVYMNISISQLLNSAAEQLGLVIIFEDISREIKMEDEFRRMGELAAVGQLAASIAHELRNPLSSIKGAAQFLRNEYEDHAAIVEFLGIIIEEVNGLNKLTTEFLDFARPMQLELKPTSVNAIVDRTLQLMSVHITDSNVVVKENLADSVPIIQADEKQIEQVLKNVIINALQAMPEGGAITLETGPTPSNGAYVMISDTGLGIPPEKINRIFQPFVTTKTKGTGLGLSVVEKIIENHGGRIEVESEQGKGTRFRILLPQIGAHVPITAEMDQTMERRMSGGRRVEG